MLNRNQYRIRLIWNWTEYTNFIRFDLVYQFFCLYYNLTDNWQAIDGKLAIDTWLFRNSHQLTEIGRLVIDNCQLVPKHGKKKLVVRHSWWEAFCLLHFGGVESMWHQNTAGELSQWCSVVAPWLATQGIKELIGMGWLGHGKLLMTQGWQITCAWLEWWIWAANIVCCCMAWW